jgi:hypothetical protein
MNRIGIGMVAAEVGQRDSIDHRSRRSAKPAFQNVGSTRYVRFR